LWKRILADPDIGIENAKMGAPAVLERGIVIGAETLLRLIPDEL
jgi:hypothetical protein